MDHLQTEARNPASMNLDELTPLEFVELMNTEDLRAVEAVRSQAGAIAHAIEIITERLRAGARLVYVGAGTSGRLGVLDAAECPPTFSSPPGQVIGVIAGGHEALTRAVEGAEDHPEFAHRDLATLNLSANDVLVGIATSGRTPYVVGAMEYARAHGAFVIGFSCNIESEISNRADLAITPIVGPEVLSGSTRLKAGTATKLVLNMLTTGAMVRLGKTYGNLMVDLRATNSKLRARSNRIVRIFTGISGEEADTLLAHCGGELKTALVAHRAQLAPEEARIALAAAGGGVRAALERIENEHARDAAPANDLCIGIDGGGTHTIALLVRNNGFPIPDEAILGRGEAGPSNIHAVGATAALAALDDAVARAFAVARLPRAPVRAVCLGLAGAGRLDDQRLIQEWAERDRLATHVQVTTDAELLLAAGTPDNWGLALVAGTGSIAYARSPDGHVARAGGWGYLLGDEGSGYAIAMAALRAAVRAEDVSAPPTRLARQLLHAMGIQTIQELVPQVYGGNWNRTALATLAPLVLEAASAGDPAAATIVDDAVGELAETAAAAAARLFPRSRVIPLALSGGLFLGNPDYRTKVVDHLTRRGVSLDTVTLVKEPALGAVRLAAASVK
jgi:N-acetylmuramic acid 6-phosphate etherase